MLKKQRLKKKSKKDGQKVQSMRDVIYKVNNHMRAYGQTDLQKRIIEINKKKSKKSISKGELLDSIVHEQLHLRHPKASERKVISMTEKKTKQMSHRQKDKVYKKLK